MCLDIHIIEQKNIIGSYNFLVSSYALNTKFTLIFMFMLSILVTFSINSNC
jgi:hypothetical protein